MKKLKQILEEFKTKKWKKDQLLILVLFGILLLVIAIPVKSPNKDGENSAGKSDGGGIQEKEEGGVDAGSGEASGGKEDQLFLYAESMENRLEKTLSYVEGVGKVRVMITLKDGGEAVVEKDSQKTRSSATETDSAGGARKTQEETGEEETVYENLAGGMQNPYITREIEPMIEGVIVVAQGGGNAVVSAQITEAIQALFSVEAHKIKIMKMK